MVDTFRALSDLCSQMESSPCIALDTEFISGKHPDTILAVVQAACTTGEAFLIDALAFDDLSALRNALESTDIVKIMHDAGQDLGLLANASGAVPKNIFDVKLAARLLGMGTNYSLSELVQTICRVRLSKGQQRSDWLRRPLSSAQIRYAERDVLYLHEIREALLTEAKKKGRTTWIREEMHAFDDPRSYTPPPAAERILSSPGTHSLKPGQCAAIAALADWRKQISQATGIFPKKLLGNAEILRLARRRCVKPGAVRNLCPSLPRRYEAKVASLIAEALNTSPDKCPVPLAPRPLTSAETAQLQLLQAVISGRALELGIQADLIGTTSMLTDFVLNPEDPASPLQNGWRRDAVGRDLSDVLQGKYSVGMHDGLLKVRPLSVQCSVEQSVD